MAKYIIRFSANASAWPTDPKGVLELWEGVIAGANALLESGAMEEVYWTSNIAGYAFVEAASKDAAIGVATLFFPLFNQEIDEGVPAAEATAAILASAKAAVGQ